jgi:hypothetical protein
MVMRRRLAVLIAMMGAFIVVIVITALVLSDRRVAMPSDLKIKYERIQDGMSKDEVERLLGVNHGEWLSKKDADAEDREFHWGADDGVAAVTFEDDKVIFKRWDERQPPRSALQRWLDTLLLRE